jgi:hypothetical protein
MKANKSNVLRLEERIMNHETKRTYIVLGAALGGTLLFMLMML